MSRVLTKLVFGISDQVQHKPNSATVQPQKMVRGSKLRVEEVEGLYYLCKENKGADYLSGYHAADLRLYFRIWKKQVFL